MFVCCHECFEFSRNAPGGAERISSEIPCAFRVKLGKLLDVQPSFFADHAKLRGSLVIRHRHLALGDKGPL